MFTCRIAEDAELRLWEPWHAEALFATVDRNREHLRRWLPWADATKTAEDSRAFLQRSVERFAKDEGFHAGLWLIAPGGSRRVAGGIGVFNVLHNQRKAEIGYWLAEDAQGRGLMTSACRAVIDHLFRERGLHRVEIQCAPENRRSCAVPERLGFTREGVLRQSGWLYGRPIDHVVYGMLAPEWGQDPAGRKSPVP